MQNNQQKVNRRVSTKRINRKKSQKVNRKKLLKFEMPDTVDEVTVTKKTTTVMAPQKVNRSFGKEVPERINRKWRLPAGESASQNGISPEATAIINRMKTEILQLKQELANSAADKKTAVEEKEKTQAEILQLKLDLANKEIERKNAVAEKDRIIMEKENLVLKKVDKGLEDMLEIKQRLGNTEKVQRFKKYATILELLFMKEIPGALLKEERAFFDSWGSRSHLYGVEFHKHLYSDNYYLEPGQSIGDIR
jgi:hypothetical protein